MDTIAISGNGMDAQPVTAAKTPLSSWVGLAVMVAISVYAVVDRQVFILFAEAIRKDLGLNDTQLGMLQGLGLSLFGLVMVYPISWLADRHDRRKVIAICIFLWSIAVAGCGLAPTFLPLFVCASLVGIGEAGAGPAGLAMIPDLFPPHARQLGNSVFAVAGRFGSAFGVWLTGLLIVLVEWARPMLPASVAALPEWRLCFFAAILFMPVALVMALTLPQRTSGIEARLARGDSKAERIWPYLRQHKTPFFGVIGAALLAGLGLVAVAGWVPIIAQRYYGQTPKESGDWLAIMALITGIVGLLISQPLLRWLQPRAGLQTPIYVLVGTMVFSAATSGLIATAQNVPQLYGYWGLQAVGLMIGAMILPTLLQNMAPPPLRARVFALYTLVNITTAIGYILVGSLSDLLSGTPRGLLYAAMAVAVVCLTLSALVYWLTRNSYARLVEVVATME